MLAAVAAMAFVGAGTASATKTVLCHLDEKTVAPCPGGSLPYTGTLLALKGGTETLGISLFQSGTIHIECETEMHGKVTSAGAPTNNTPLGLIEKVTFTNCVSPQCVDGVTAAPHNLPWKATATAGATLGSGTLHVTNHGSGNPGGLFTCVTLPFGVKVSVTCGYSTESALGTFDGHTATTSSKLLVNAIELKRVHGSNALCAETAKWTYLPFIDPSDLSLHLVS